MAVMNGFGKLFSSFFYIKRLKLREKESFHQDDEDGQAEPLVEEKAVASDFESVQQRSQPSRPYLISCPAFATIILLSLLFGALLAIILETTNLLATEKYFQTTQTKMIKPCGETPQEARTKGCHFDVISFNWLPDDCYDAALSAEFDEINKLEWFLDANRTQPLSHDQITTGEYTGLYVNWEYHMRHCTAMWKKMHRAILSDLGARAIDGYIGSFEHTKHCEHMLLSKFDFDIINTRIAVKYPDCGI